MGMGFAHASQSQHDAALEAAFAAVNGLMLGTVQRRYGLLTSEESVCVSHAIERCSDLAVADRVAWMHAVQLRRQVVVFEHDGWYWVGQLEVSLTPEQARDVVPLAVSPRLLSIASERGILPLVGPLAAAAG